jgi:hypothetical protein
MPLHFQSTAPQEEYFEASNQGYRPPELNLLAAVLWRAIHDYFSDYAHIRRAAEEWLFEEESRRPFGMFWVCQNLGFDRGAIRAGVKAQKAAGNTIHFGVSDGEGWDRRLRA